MMFSKVRILALFSAVAAVHSAAVADTVTLAPPEGVTTNVLSLITGNTAVEVAGPGTVKLNPSNMHTGGTTLSGGTLILTGDIPAGGPSPVGIGTFTVSGGTLRGTGTFGGDITGTGAFAVEAPDGWAWSGDNTFAEAVTLSDGALEIAGGTTTFSLQFFLGTQGGTGEDVSLAMSGGTVTMGEKNLFLSPGSRTKSTFTMTGGAWNMNNHRIITGFQTTYATNVTDISGTAAVTNSEYCYTYSGAGNCWSLNVHDGGLFATKGPLYANGGGAVIDISAYNGGDISAKRIYAASGSTVAISVTDGGVIGFTNIYANTSGLATLAVDGGTLANESASSEAYFDWIASTVDGLTVGPGGATFLGGTSSACAQINCPVSAAETEAGATPKGVTFDGGNWGYYSDSIAYEGPTVLKNGAKLMLPKAGSIPNGSAVTVGSGCELRVGNTAKTVSSLVLENDAVLAFSSTLKALTVSDALTLPSRAKIALYNANTPTTTAKNTNGSYAVLKVPASYADALRAVSWSCATATSGMSYTFSVTTSGGTATLTMTISSAPSGSFTVSGDTALGGTLSVGGDITIGSGATLAAAPLYGSATGGSITINNGGTLDASGGNIRPVDKSGNSFHLYLNEGGTLVVNQIHGSDNATIKAEATATGMFHFNGGTIYPVAFEVDSNRFLVNYQTVVVGAKGVTVDLNRWIRPDGYTTWTRCSIQGNFNHDSNCAGSDGGITVRGIKGEERSVVLFGSRFGGSTLNGGIHVEGGTTVAVHERALVGQTIELAPGSRFRPYDNNTVNIKNMTIGSNGDSEAVRLDLPSNSVSAPGVAVSGTLSVLSPVEIAFTSGWSVDSTISSGTYTALVYQATSSVDPALFRLPANAPVGATLAADEVTLTGGDYAGRKALVVTIANDIVVTGSTSYPTPLTVSSDASVGSIVVGGKWNGEEDPVCETSLTVSGNITASEGLYLGYNPAHGENADDWHKGFLILNGGTITTPLFYSIYRSGVGSGDANCRFGCEMTVNDGLLNVKGDVRLGYSRSRNGDNLYSCITVNNGGVAVGGKFYLLYVNTDGAYTAPGSIVLNDGEVDVKGVIDMSRNSANPAGNQVYANKFGIWLNGGVLKAENITMTASTANSPQVCFNGGVYAPYGAKAENRTMSSPNRVYVSTNGAVISTENIPAGATYTIAQALLTDPALDGAADGGLVKKGSGTLALSGANTYTGPTKVEAGTLVAANADALSCYVEVADGAVLDLGESDASVARIAASGAVAGNLTVTDAIVLGDGGSVLSVVGNLAFGNRAAIDFGLGEDDEVQAVWTPIAAVSGEINVPKRIKARNAGANFTRADTCIMDGVLYAKPCAQGLMLIMR